MYRENTHMHGCVHAYTCVDMHMYVGMFASPLGMQDLIIIM